MANGRWSLHYTRYSSSGPKEESRDLRADGRDAAAEEAKGLYAKFRQACTRRHSPVDPVDNPRLVYEEPLER